MDPPGPWSFERARHYMAAAGSPPSPRGRVRPDLVTPAAIIAEDFDALMAVYSDDAVLVVRPGVIATGKAQIRKAFEKIAAHFEHSLQVRQEGMVVLESGDIALVLANTVVSASNMPALRREATSLFRRDGPAGWLCAIDNSYGHELLSEGAPVGGAG